MSSFSFDSFFSWVSSLLHYHYVVLFFDLDTVKDVTLYGINMDDLLKRNYNKNGGKSAAINSQYLFPFGVIFYTFLDCAYMFYRNNFHYVIEKMPRMFFHLVWPSAFWEFSDIMMAFAIGMCLFMYPSLLTDPLLANHFHTKFTMYLEVEKAGGHVEIICNGAVLEEKEAERIFRFRRRMHTAMPVMMVEIYLLIETFFFFYFYHAWIGTLHDYVMLVCIILFFFYLCISNLFMLYYFSLAISYIKIKQDCREKKLSSLSTTISVLQAKSGVQNSQGKSSSDQHYRLWLEQKKINREVLAIYEEIRAQNRFWCRYLSIYFVVYIIEICYLSYVFFFNHSPDLMLERCFCLLIAVDFLIIIVFVTFECSVIVNRGCSMARQSQRIALKLQRIYAVKLADLLKIDQMASNYKNIAGICFKLLNNYRINSQMFQLIFSYISIFFMMILQKQQKAHRNNMEF